MNINRLLTIRRRLRAFNRYKITTIFLNRQQRLRQVINSRDQLCRDTFTRLTRSFISRFTFTRNIVSFRIRDLTGLPSFLFTLTIRIMTSLFLSNLWSKRATMKDLRASNLTIRGNFTTTIRDRTSTFGRLFNRQRRPIMILMLRMRFRANGLQVVTLIRAFISRILTCFVRAFGTTRSRTFRMGLNNSARVRISVGQIIIYSRQTNTNSSNGKLRSKHFRFHMSNFIRCNARNLRRNNALRRDFFRTIVRSRIRMALTMTRFQIIREIVGLSIFRLCSKRKLSTLNRCNRFLNVRASFTNLNSRRVAFSSSRVTRIRWFLRGNIMRFLIFAKTSIVTNSVCLGTTFKVLRFRREDLSRSTTTRSATNGTRLAFLFEDIVGFFFCVNKRDINKVFVNEVKISTWVAGFIRVIPSCGFLFAWLWGIRIGYVYCRYTGVIGNRNEVGWAHLFFVPGHVLSSVFCSGVIGLTRVQVSFEKVVRDT